MPKDLMNRTGPSNTWLGIFAVVMLVGMLAVGQFAFHSGRKDVLNNMVKIGGMEHHAAHAAVLNCSDTECYYTLEPKSTSAIHTYAAGTVSMNLTGVLRNQPVSVRIGTETLGIRKRHGQQFEPGEDVTVKLTFSHHIRNVFVLANSEIVEVTNQVLQ